MNRCRDEGDDAPGCLGVADERYTMRFGEPPIYWCTVCGQRAHAMQRAIDRAFAGDPGFAKDFADAIDARAREAELKFRFSLVVSFA